MEISRTFMNWSSGKDCSLALYHLFNNPGYKVDHLFTTVAKKNKRIGMHGLPESLLKKQANAIGLPLEVLYLPEDNGMEAYNKLMEKQMINFIDQNYTHAAFGDIFLEDLKTYREEQLNLVGLKGVFPLWKKNTKELLKEFIELNFKAVVVAASAKHFDQSFVGMEIGHDFLDHLPKEVDPCGENGEFHTFCYDGPIFEQVVEFTKGEKIVKSYPNPTGDGKIDFHFIDLQRHAD